MIFSKVLLGLVSNGNIPRLPTGHFHHQKFIPFRSDVYSMPIAACGGVNSQRLLLVAWPFSHWGWLCLHQYHWRCAQHDMVQRLSGSSPTIAPAPMRHCRARRLRLMLGDVSAIRDRSLPAVLRRPPCPSHPTAQLSVPRLQSYRPVPWKECRGADWS